MDDRMGENINGPSLIRVPDWVRDPLGQYYLYFAHHQGTYIRLAYADCVEGPWRIYSPGTLQLAQTPCRGHIASPDVHIDHDRKRIHMYYHGPVDPDGPAIHRSHDNVSLIVGKQQSFLATSTDGIRFDSATKVLGSSYLRVFRWNNCFYALGMPGIFYRSRNGLGGFVQGPTRFTPDMRHAAVKVEGNRLRIFYSNVHDAPERILQSTINLESDWTSWQPSDPLTVLEPAMDYEGASLPNEPSQRGWAPRPVRQLRDPAIYQEGDRTYLLYSVAGERGIAIAQIEETND
jgi:hypothetical protein